MTVFALPKVTADQLKPGLAGLALAVLLAGCAPERRALGPSPPQTPPTGPGDPRAQMFEKNAYQVSQGSRLFTWYGCAQCHGTGAPAGLDFSAGRWRHGGGVDQVYASIAKGRGAAMPAYEPKVPTEQLWQLTAYVRQLPATKPTLRRRQDLDQQAEPQNPPPPGAKP